MWRRVASQSPLDRNDPNRDYIKSFAAMTQMLREGRSLSGHERKCCFLNTGGPRFATISHASGLNNDDDGRAAAFVDWDFDGDLDLWLANRTGPRLRFMRNDAPSDHHFVAFKLEGKSCNRDAIGARVEVHSTTADRGPTRKRIRTLHAGEGFLSQQTRWLHFGLGKDDRIQRVVVRWPGRDVETIAGAEVDRFYRVVQGQGRAEQFQPPRRPIHQWPAAPVNQAPSSNQARIVLASRLPVPAIKQTAIKAGAASGNGRPVLINLWATWCRPCLVELKELTENQERIARAGLDILALNVDELNDDPKSDLSKARRVLDELKFPFASAAIDPEAGGVLDVFQRGYFSLRRPLPLPSSLLVTPDGHLAVIYRGPVSVPQVLADLELFGNQPSVVREAAVPFAGKWKYPPPVSSPRQQVLALMREGYVEGAADYLSAHLKRCQTGEYRPPSGYPRPERDSLATLCDLLADLRRLTNDRSGVIAAYRMAIDFSPNFTQGRLALAKALLDDGQPAEGMRHMQIAASLAPRNAEVQTDYGVALARLGRLDAAISQFHRVLSQDPGYAPARQYLQKAQQQLGSGQSPTRSERP